MKKTLKVNGIHCRNCATYLEKALKGVPGVTSASADLPTESAVVECNDSVTDDMLKDASNRAGFEVISIS